MAKIINHWLNHIAPRQHRAGRAVLKLTIIALLLFLTGCASLVVEEKKVEEVSELIVEETPPVIESGLASFYGDRHHNQRTASGERYRHELKTAAHRTLALGSYVKVTNSKTGNSVVVKINDRGPFVKGRIIDLSKSAFKEIGDTAQGLITVDVQVIE